MFIQVMTVLYLVELVGSLLYLFYCCNTTARTDGTYLPDGSEA